MVGGGCQMHKLKHFLLLRETEQIPSQLSLDSIIWDFDFHRAKMTFAIPGK